MNEIEKLASIINNGLNNLSKQITDLINKKTEKPIINIPPIKMPEMPAPLPFPDIPAPIVNVDTTGIEKVLKEGLGNNKYPIVNVEKPDPVTVNVPAPIVNVAPTEFPKEFQVKGIDDLNAKMTELINAEVKNPIGEINSKKPLAVMVIDKNGKPVSDFGGEFSAPNVVGLRIGTTVLSASHPLPVAMGFQIPVYDTEVIDATLAPTTTVITYKLAGVTVKTKTISVSGTITTITLT